MSAPRLIESLPDLVRQDLISAEQADRIRAQYDRPQQQGDRLLLLFSILGGTLIGLGLILLVAHNWEDLSRPVRIGFSFHPLAIGQGLVLFTLLRRANDRGWREGSSLFLLFAVGACIALISQIFHIPGGMDSFLFAWSLLIVVLLYVPGSNVSLMIYLAMITWYAGAVRGLGHGSLPVMYLPLLIVALPSYVQLARSNGRSIMFFWASMILALSFGIASQLFWRDAESAIIPAIAAIAAAYTLAPFLHGDPELRTGAFPVLGTIAMIGALIAGSYAEVWENGDRIGKDVVPFIVSLLIGIISIAFSLPRRKLFERILMPESFLVLVIAFIVSRYSPGAAATLINLWMLGAGIQYVRWGIAENRLWRMNLGLLLIALVIMLRFFDLDIGYAMKGVVFILIGSAFLLMNLRLIRQRRTIGHA